MASSETSEHRKDRRQRVLKGASILTGVSNSEVKCLIRNMHADGAELKVDLDARIPSEFLLYVPVDGIAYKAVLRWRKEGRVGVTFIGNEPKPAWHYG